MFAGTPAVDRLGLDGARMLDLEGARLLDHRGPEVLASVTPRGI